MTFKENLVVVIKVHGKVLREIDGTVRLPFGSEYSIFVKNLESVRAQIKVSVDGKDATEGTSLIIGPNSGIELERFIRNGNLSTGNRFKFIERSDSIEEHRGIQAEDGLVRIEAWREHVQQFVNVPIPQYYEDWRPLPPLPRPWRPSPWHPWRTDPGFMRSAQVRSSSRRPQASAANRSTDARAAYNNLIGTRTDSSSSDYSVVNDVAHQDTAGITVPGSESHQQFHRTSGFPVEPQSRVIVLRLVGAVNGIEIAKPITVKTKLECSSCGLSNEPTSRFCTSCGTSLILI